MDKNVLITVGGLLYTGSGEGEKDNVDVISPGQYYYKEGKHYLFYDEVVEETPETIKNRIEITPDEVKVSKRGIINTEMEFRPKEETKTHYSTPFGTLIMGIRTDRIQVEEKDDSLEALIEYNLEVNYEHVSECFIRILVQSKTENGGFTLSE